MILRINKGILCDIVRVNDLKERGNGQSAELSVNKISKTYHKIVLNRSKINLIRSRKHKTNKP